MPFILILAAIMIFLSTVFGTIKPLGAQLYKDIFSGSPNYLEWAAAFVIVGLIGYVPEFRKVSYAFLALIVVIMFLADNGVFAQFESALKSGPTPVAASNPLAPISVAASASQTASSGTAASGSSNAASVAGAADAAVQAATGSSTIFKGWGLN